MQRTMQKSEELYIENPRLDHKTLPGSDQL